MAVDGSTRVAACAVVRCRKAKRETAGSHSPSVDGIGSILLILFCELAVVVVGRKCDEMRRFVGMSLLARI